MEVYAHYDDEKHVGENWHSRASKKIRWQRPEHAVRRFDKGWTEKVLLSVIQGNDSERNTYRRLPTSSSSLRAINRPTNLARPRMLQLFFL